jgi:hypothetical protein
MGFVSPHPSRGAATGPANALLAGPVEALVPWQRRRAGAGADVANSSLPGPSCGAHLANYLRS